nr:MAG TPA: hypothetical protein [Caudoviricetes sp.]
MISKYQALDDKKHYNNLLAQILLSEAYDIEYGLYNHDDPALNHPLQTHLMTEYEKIEKYGPVNKLIDQYQLYQIQKFFGLTLFEYLDLPANRFDYITEKARDWTIKETEKANAVQSQLDSAASRMESDAFRTQYDNELNNT